MKDISAGDLDDPLQMAIHLTRMEGVIATLQQGFTSTNQNLTSAMQSMQADVRKLTDTLQDFGSVQSGLHENREAVKRIWERMEQRDEQWQERWDQYLAAQAAAAEKAATEESRWKTNHEKDNKETSRLVNRMAAISVGISIAVAASGGVVAWFANKNIDLANHNVSLANSDRARIDAEQREEAKRTDTRLDKLEIFLAGNPARPFQR